MCTHPHVVGAEQEGGFVDTVSVVDQPHLAAVASSPQFEVQHHREFGLVLVLEPVAHEWHLANTKQAVDRLCVAGSRASLAFIPSK